MKKFIAWAIVVLVVVGVGLTIYCRSSGNKTTVAEQRRQDAVQGQQVAQQQQAAAKKAEAKRFEANLDVFAGGDQKYEFPAWLQLKRTPGQEERAIRYLIETYFPQNDQPEDLETAGRYIYELGGARAMDIVLKYTDENVYSVVVAKNAQDWCQRYRPGTTLGRIEAMEAAHGVRPAVTNAPAVTAPQPAPRSRRKIQIRIDASSAYNPPNSRTVAEIQNDMKDLRDRILAQETALEEALADALTGNNNPKVAVYRHERIKRHQMALADLKSALVRLEIQLQRAS